MLKKMSKEEKQEMVLVIGVGVAFLTGVFLGSKLQYKVDAAIVRKSLKGAAIFKPNPKPMFPDTMPLSEIKEALSKIDGAVVQEAIVTTVNGIQSIIVR